MRFVRLGVLCVSCFAASPSAVAAQGPALSLGAQSLTAAPKVREPDGFRASFVTVAKSVKPAVVTVTAVLPVDFFFRHPVMRAPQEPQGSKERRGVGTGVIVGKDGTILTNTHVIDGATELKVVLEDGRELRAKVMGADGATDIAVIRIEPAELAGVSLATVPLGRSADLEVGEWVMAIGAPFGLKQTVSAGIVSALGCPDLGVSDCHEYVQTDAGLNPANSGGPLVNLRGEVIGINTAVAARDAGTRGGGLAIPIDLAQRVMDQLVRHGSAPRGYLGAFVTNLTGELAASFGYHGTTGVLVQDVEHGSPAAKAGMAPGDIIVRRNGQEIGGAVTFRSDIAAAAPNTVVKLEIWRNGKPIKVSLALGKLVEDASAALPATGEGDKTNRGFRFRELTPELRARLHYAGQGVVITEVELLSAAARGGLQDGDILVGVGSEPVTSVAGALEQLAQVPANKPVRIRLVRDTRGMFLILPAAMD